MTSSDDALRPDYRLSRRRLLVGLSIAGAAFAACSAPAPSPTTAPTPPPTSAAAKASDPAQPAAPGAAKAGWEEEWNRVLEAGRKEGKVVIAGPFGTLYRDAVLAFNQAYPDITVEFSGGNGRDQGPKILAERNGGQYLWDVHIGGSGTMISLLKPNNALDPIRNYIIRPDVLDDSKWVSGFADTFKDTEGQYVFGFAGLLVPNVYVNREFVPESELNSVEQLLDPKWEGKISWNDPRGSGAGSVTAGLFYLTKGEQWLERFFEHGVVPIADLRQQIEFMVRNRHPIGVAADEVVLNEFQNEGIGKEIQALDPNGPLGSRVTGGFGSLSILNQPPHPNATKVFVNWFLSAEGQESWARTTEQNSRRNDVWGLPDRALKPGVKYDDMQKEVNVQYQTKAIELAKRILK